MVPRSHSRRERNNVFFAGKNQGGQQGADEGHDHRNGPRHQKLHALGRRIVPEARLQADGCGRAAAQGCGLPGCDQALTVALDVLGRVGLRAVHQHLQHPSAAALQDGVEILADDQHALHYRIAHVLRSRVHIPHRAGGKPGGMGKIRRQAEGVAAAALVQHGQTQHARVQGDAVAEQKQKDERQHPGHQIGGRIPHYLLKFLAHQGHKLLYPQRFFHTFHRQLRSPRAAAPPFIGGAPCRTAQYWR